jgi:hypothetical protein
LQQFAVALNFNTIHEQVMHTSWLIGSQSLAIGWEIDHSTNGPGGHCCRIKDNDVGQRSNS